MIKLLSILEKVNVKSSEESFDCVVLSFQVTENIHFNSNVDNSKSIFSFVVSFRANVLISSYIVSVFKIALCNEGFCGDFIFASIALMVI